MNRTVRRMLMVEADNTFKVQLLEYLIVQSDCQLSVHCEHLMVFRSADVAMRSPKNRPGSTFIEECDFQEFYEQIVSDEFKDSTTGHLLDRALSNKPEEKVVLVKKPKKTAKANVPVDTFDEQLWAPLTSSMINMGYTKAQMVKFARENEEKLTGLDMTEQLKFALRVMSRP